MDRHHKKHHFHRRGRPFQRGDFKYILLRHLKEKPSYGYEIIRALEDRFHGFYAPSAGSVYPTLQMLEEMGYISSVEREGKKIYKITGDGVKFLSDEKESADRVESQINSWWNPENVDDVSEAISELERFTSLFRIKARTADTGELNRMRGALSRAHDEILKE